MVQLRKAHTRDFNGTRATNSSASQDKTANSLRLLSGRCRPSYPPLLRWEALPPRGRCVLCQKGEQRTTSTLNENMDTQATMFIIKGQMELGGTPLQVNLQVIAYPVVVVTQPKPLDGDEWKDDQP